MVNIDKCLLCSSKCITSSLQGNYKILSCKTCSFSWIHDNHKHLDEDWFDEYYKRRIEGASNKLLLKQREEQYKIDSLFVKDYIKDSNSILDIGCSYGKFL